MDEVQLIIKGKVDDWRIQRQCAFLIHRSLVENPVNILNEIPLPFDDEIKELMESEKITTEEQAKDVYDKQLKKIKEKKSRKK